MTILQFVLWSVLKVAVVTVVMLLAVAYTVLLERKLVGRIQNRWGPSRVGPFGLLQPLVDGAKSFLKEDIIPTGVYRPLYLIAPIIALGCALISIGVVPFGEPSVGPGGSIRGSWPLRIWRIVSRPATTTSFVRASSAARP